MLEDFSASNDSRSGDLNETGEKLECVEMAS